MATLKVCFEIFPHAVPFFVVVLLPALPSFSDAKTPEKQFMVFRPYLFIAVICSLYLTMHNYCLYRSENAPKSMHFFHHNTLNTLRINMMRSLFCGCTLALEAALSVLLAIRGLGYYYRDSAVANDHSAGGQFIHLLIAFGILVTVFVVACTTVLACSHVYNKDHKTFIEEKTKV